MTFKDIIKEAKEITFGLKLWAAEIFERCLPDQVRRMVLIELHRRAMDENTRAAHWNINVKQLYKTLRD